MAFFEEKQKSGNKPAYCHNETKNPVAEMPADENTTPPEMKEVEHTLKA
jgi:hypothetical protein